MTELAATLATVWSAIVGFVKSPVGRWACVSIACALAILAFGQVRYSAGIKHQKAVYAAQTAKAAQKVAKVEAAGGAITADVAGKLDKTTTEIRWRTRVQLQEVTRYVPVQSDRACVVGAGAVQLHNHAFAGLPGLPAVAGGSVEADSGVALSALVADDVEFAGTAYSWKAEALAWRDWYTRQAALWHKTIKASP